MWKDKPTGVKILWFWTIGTAAVLLTSVSRTRYRDMEKVMNAQQQLQDQQQQQEHEQEQVQRSDEIIRE